MTVPPTAVGTFRDKRGNFWISVEAVCDFLGVDFGCERKRIKAMSRVLHPHNFMRHRLTPPRSRTRYYIFSLPASELLPWINAVAETPSYKCPKSGRRFTVDRQRLQHIRRSLKNQKALSKARELEEVLSA